MNLADVADWASAVFVDRWAYAFSVALLLIGMYGMLVKQNLVKKLIGMNIFQGSIILFYLIFAYKEGASVPVFDEAMVGASAASYMNPIPHGLMLTAIVVSVAITGVALSLLVVIWRRYGTLEESELLEKLRRETQNETAVTAAG